MKNPMIGGNIRQHACMSGRGLSGVSRLAARALLPFILLSFLIASPALADGVILATGMSGGGLGSPLAAGAVDTNWTITGVSGTSAYVLGNYTGLVGAGTNWGSGAWTQPGAYTWNVSGAGNAQWIGASINDSGLPPAGTQYSFNATFNLGSVTPSTVLTITWAIDDGGTLYVNGHQVSTLTTPGYGTPAQFVVPNADLNAFGSNTVVATMASSDDANNDGMILYATVTGSPVPAPAALLLFGPGFAALVLVRKRLKK